MCIFWFGNWTQSNAVERFNRFSLVRLSWIRFDDTDCKTLVEVGLHSIENGAYSSCTKSGNKQASFSMAYNADSFRLTLSLLNRGFARQPCCMAETMKLFCIRKNILSHRKNNLLSLPWKMAAVQNLYCHEKPQISAINAIFDLNFIKMTPTFPKLCLHHVFIFITL